MPAFHSALTASSKSNTSIPDKEEVTISFSGALTSSSTAAAFGCKPSTTSLRPACLAD